jgi:hypothetical protein
MTHAGLWLEQISQGCRRILIGPTVRDGEAIDLADALLEATADIERASTERTIASTSLLVTARISFAPSNRNASRSRRVRSRVAWPGSRADSRGIS